MRRILTTVATVLTFSVSAAFAADSYVNFDNDGNIVVSGPFNAVIPKPPGARTAGPVHSSPSFLDEQLQISTAAYFADDQFVTVQVETTNAGAGTLTNKNLPVVEIAGTEFRARSGCFDIDQERVDTSDDPIVEFLVKQDVQILPAMQAVQLVVINADGTAEGSILFMRNVPGGCGAISPEVKARFDADFERFVASIRAAN
jgi:hypothetical protein